MYANFIMDRLQCDDALDILPEHIRDHVRRKEVEGPFTDNSTSMGGHLVELAKVPGMTVERARQFINWATITRNYPSNAYFTGKDAERAVAPANQKYGYALAVGWQRSWESDHREVAARGQNGSRDGRSSQTASWVDACPWKRHVSTPKNPLDWSCVMLKNLRKLARGTEGNLMRAHQLMKRAVNLRGGTFIVEEDLEKAVEFALAENACDGVSKDDVAGQGGVQPEQQQDLEKEPPVTTDEGADQLEEQPRSEAPGHSQVHEVRTQSTSPATGTNTDSAAPFNSADIAQDASIAVAETIEDQRNETLPSSSSGPEQATTASQPLRMTQAEPGYQEDDDDVKDSKVRYATSVSDRKELVQEASAATLAKAARRMTTDRATTPEHELEKSGNDVVPGSGNAAEDNTDSKASERCNRHVQHFSRATHVDAATSTAANNTTEYLEQEARWPTQATMAIAIPPATSAPKLVPIRSAAQPALRNPVSGASQAARQPDSRSTPAARLNQPAQNTRPGQVPRQVQQPLQNAAVIAYGLGATAYDPHRAAFVNRFYVARHAQLKFEAEWAHQALTAYDAMRASGQADNPAMRGGVQARDDGRQADGR
ncbi:hypothetical protein EJ03DRAFT_366010 [Teratosphaeria nubilosa]|uniref:Uncharacterized protein n=1 Tax=Teratosphaeria nubilosa TaxID=161662 RepID=A0A6G1L329_9PEZI|nr:hypothetical protein EJ03DRAFT_366010 [Teratosphaeria nubilosa]